MPAIREHDTNPSNMDDDDGMPPLVDNPNPSMTFTFFTDMTPITALSADPTIPFETVWENTVPAPASPIDFADFAEPPAPFQPQEHDRDRASHGKKRDASYIPRPPNAFILFRSSFIRSQQVPEKVEGNHSTLSKIIGKYWKTLSREEREVWEAKALVAQAEHRKRYPDWRFRPGANAFAKLKVKDGPQVSNRKRAGQTGRKVKGDPSTKKAKSGDERCAIIAGLLVEGKTGIDLEDAVKRWEDSAGRARGGRNGNRACKAGKQGKVEQQQVAAPVEPLSPADCPGSGVYFPPQLRAQTPNSPNDDRFRIPLTAMFKRSLSAPAGQPSPSPMSSPIPQDSFDSVFANVSYDIAESPQGVCPPFNDPSEDLAHAVSPDAIGCLSPLVLPSILSEDAPARWNDPFNLLETSIGAPPADCPALTYALLTPPSVSPVEPSALAAAYTYGPPADFGSDMGAAYAHPREAYDQPKSWVDCTVHQAQAPIFINAYAGNAYDWCDPSLHYGAVEATPYTYPDQDPFGALGGAYGVAY